jgi:hypothetical protein
MDAPAAAVAALPGVAEGSVHSADAETSARRTCHVDTGAPNVAP